MALNYKPYRPPQTYELPPPPVFGDLIPAKYTEWRSGQAKAILTTIESDRRFVAHAAPTGFGKSLAYIGAALINGLRVCILTSTKALQDQLVRDFNGDGKQRLTVIQGQNAYRCTAAQDFDYPEYTTCDHAPCHAGVRCRLKDSGCKYYDAYRAATEAQCVSTNYAYWMSINRFLRKGLGKFDLLVLDEAHDAPDLLADFMQVEIEPGELLPLGARMLDPGADIIQWREWAQFNLARLVPRLEALQGTIRGYVGAGVPANVLRESAILKRLQTKLTTLAAASDDWVTERVDKDKRGAWAMRFDPIWPYKWSEQLLFLSIPRVMLVSATLREKTLKLLGVDPADYDFHEYDSDFPVSRRPVIHVPTVQMNHRTPPENLGLWLQRIDQLISRRTDRKGIIHTVSFARAKMILENSDYRGMMLLNDSRNTKWTVEQFKRSTRPCILVSPSVTTGYDFPYTECEYQIIGKLPFPDNRAKVIKARLDQDKAFSDYMTMQVLIQMAGRGMRSKDDSCETLVIDDSISWFLNRNKAFAPKWFRDAIVLASSVPAPLPKLQLPF